MTAEIMSGAAVLYALGMIGTLRIKRDEIRHPLTRRELAFEILFCALWLPAFVIFAIASAFDVD